MKKPVIGITISKKADKVEGFKNFVPSAYVIAVKNAGGIPLLIPNEFPLDDVSALCAELAGVLLSGGGDLHPSHYHQARRVETSNICAERDELEIKLASLAVDMNLPILGICRGHQLINVALGGTLYQHLPADHPSSIAHNTPDSISKDHIAHQVEIVKNTALHNILGVAHLDVNSRHHQAVNEPAPGLLVTACASDGLIEAFELPGHHFCVGVQWHPENFRAILEHRNIFESFISAAIE